MRIDQYKKFSNLLEKIKNAIDWKVNEENISREIFLTDN